LKISPRYFSVFFQNSNKFYVYGGYGIDKITQKKLILNDFYAFDISDIKDSFREITPKGGAEMEGYIFKALRIYDNQIAFFCSDLSRMFIYDIKTETFQRILFKFINPAPRNYFTINLLTDGRIILFGGMDKDTCFEDAFIMQPFTYLNEVHYSWTALDISGPLEKFYNGHASIVLDNNHILIHGGCTSIFDPIVKDNLELDEDELTDRFKILNIYSTYQWIEPIGICL
jgi:N-acetylneuraminic acid mutarotase